MNIGKDLKQNTPTIDLNVLCIEEKEICPANISRINSICEKQIIILMIPNVEKEGWHYLVVKEICIITWNNFKT